MESDDTLRKLATILAADVVGYSAMMGRDEEKTLRTLRRARQTVQSMIDKHRGRVFKEAGDAFLAEFISPVDAVRCAIAFQEEIQNANQRLSENDQMWFRIGINIGDVMVEGDDLFGDGVNVAARLEGIAEKGGICISGSVFEQVKNKLSVGYHDAGPQNLKNISYPVYAYRLVPGEVYVEQLPRARRRWLVTGALAGILLLVLSATWIFYGNRQSSPANRIDGRWEVTVDKRTGCNDNETKVYPVVVSQGLIDEPTQRVPKRGSVSC